eukprot:4764196-Pyramimonas_sp.AAC.1
MLVLDPVVVRHMGAPHLLLGPGSRHLALIANEPAEPERGPRALDREVREARLPEQAHCVDERAKPLAHL